jgi:hypothetical protein
LPVAAFARMRLTISSPPPRHQKRETAEKPVPFAVTIRAGLGFKY